MVNVFGNRSVDLSDQEMMKLLFETYPRQSSKYIVKAYENRHFKLYITVN
jgi:hypothetical protein